MLLPIHRPVGDTHQVEKSPKELNRRSRRVVRSFLALGFVLLLSIAASFFSPHPLAMEKALLSLAKNDTLFVRDGVIFPDEAEFRHALQVDVLIFGSLALFAGALYISRIHLRQLNVADHFFSVSVTAACSASLFLVLATSGHELPSCPIETLMTNPGSLSVYGQRLLVVWFADILKVLRPSLSYRACYLVTQMVAAWATTYMIGKWSAMFFGTQLKYAAQVLCVLMLIPTISYYTFYDIPLVFFFTCCLLLLYKKQYLYFVLVLAIGTLNHENTLLLVGVAFWVLYRVAPLRIWVGVPAAALAAWITTRMLLQYLVPMQSHFDLRIWNNLIDIARPSRDIAYSAATLAFWWFCAGTGFWRSAPFIRRAAILFPGLVLATFIAGKFREARQYDAFIPLAILLVMSFPCRYYAALGADVGRNATGNRRPLDDLD
jgi:hypothetical protein